MITAVNRNIDIFSLIIVSSVLADSIEIINKDNEVVDIEFYNPINSPLFGDISKEIYTFDQIDSMLVSSDYMNRAMGAAVLAGGRVADTAKCVELLINTLEGEINHPFSLEPASEVTATITEFLIEQYLYDFRVLLYTKGSQLLKPYLQRSVGDLKIFLILVAGSIGDKDMRNDIRNIYIDNKNGFIRAQAIRVMNIFPDVHDIPVLKLALKDEYHRVDRYGNKIPLIQGNARGALIKLGFTIEEIEKMRNDEE